MNNGVFILDNSGKSYGNLFRATQILYDRQSAFQKITVFDTEDLGRMLMLDDFFNVGTAMEAFYHEPMAHIPLALAEERRNVLIIGGGDFGVAKHVIKHDELERLTLCELDPRVLEVARRFFPEWAACENDPRMQTVEGDGAVYMESCSDESLDAVIIDSTDPFFNASVLISDAFYSAVTRVLKPGGVMIQIIADYFFFKKIWFDVFPAARRHFAAYKPVFVPIPLYVTGSWGLLTAAKQKERLKPEKVTPAYLNRIGGVETLTPDLVKGWFSLPPFLEAEFRDYLEG